MQKTKRAIINFIGSHALFAFVWIFFGLVVIGATCFHLIEWWRRFDSFYYAFVVMSTLWFGDFAPITDAGKVLTIFYWFIGIPLFIVGSWIILQKIFFEHLKKYIVHIHHEIEIEKKLKKEIQETIDEQEKKKSWRKRLFKKN